MTQDDKGNERADFQANPPVKDGRQSAILEWAKVLVVPVTVAIIGLIGSSWLNQRQSIEANDRLFAELISKREQADSDLRKEMFSLIINIFLGGSQYGTKGKVPTLEDPNLDTLKREILALELLVYNFNESLDLSPLFRQVYNDIGKTGNRPELERRLTSLTKEVIVKQVWVLSTSSKSANESYTKECTVDFSELEKHPEGLEIINHNSTSPQSRIRNYRVWVLNYEEARKEVQIEIRVKENENVIVERFFWVGQFDFPMLNNTRLPDGQRVSIVMTDLNPKSSKIAFVYFPGSYASLKEKPYYNEVLTDMLKGRERVNK
jgi:hypothetical protein